MVAKKSTKKTSKKTTKNTVKKTKKEKVQPGKKRFNLSSSFPQEYAGFEVRVMGDFDSSATTVAVDEGSTLTEEDIIDALDMLQQGIHQPRFPGVDYANSGWALIYALALFQVMGLRVDERNMTSSSVFGNILRTRIRWPFGRHQMDTEMSTQIENLPDTSKFEYRMAIAKDHLYGHFDEVQTWIDIAKRCKEEYTVQDLLSLKNIEQRMAALRIFGAEKLIEEAGAIEVSKTKRGNELYKIPKERGLFEEDAYFLKYQCVSTGRIYVSGVPSWLFNQRMAAIDTANRDTVNSGMMGYGWRWNTRPIEVDEKYINEYPEHEWADLAMAWKFRLTLEEYKSLPIENEG